MMSMTIMHEKELDQKMTAKGIEMRFYFLQGSTFMFLYTLLFSDDSKLLHKLYFELLSLFDNESESLDQNIFFTFLRGYSEGLATKSKKTAEQVKEHLIVKMQKVLFENNADDKEIRWLGRGFL